MEKWNGEGDGKRNGIVNEEKRSYQGEIILRMDHRPDPLFHSVYNVSSSRCPAAAAAPPPSDGQQQAVPFKWLAHFRLIHFARPSVRPSARHPTTEAALLRSSAGDAAEWHVKSASGHSFETLTDGQDALRGSARKGTKEATPAF